MTKIKPWTPVSQPFSTAYYQREHATMRALKPFEEGDLSLVRRDAKGRVDGYLYKDFNIWPDVPILTVGETLWMSITPMEVQSHYMPLLLAEGDVGVGGLGLGYATQRLLSKRDVERVTVYETDLRILALYVRHFGEHPKLRLVEQDMRTLEGKAHDFFYADIYAHVADDDLWKDWALLVKGNSIGQYHAWGLEAYLWPFVLNGRYGDLPFWMRHTYRPFFLALQKAKKILQDGWIGGRPDETVAEWETLGLAKEWGL